jgi:hypothetical protein
MLLELDRQLFVEIVLVPPQCLDDDEQHDIAGKGQAKAHHEDETPKLMHHHLQRAHFSGQIP